MTDYQKAFGRLIDTIKRLRAPDGCAWDREQTPASLRGNLVEEAFECVSAVNSGNRGALEEELGDLYMLASLIACINEESGSFTAADVLESVNEKLIRRHPHVFGSSDASTVDEIVDQWDRIKQQEKKAQGKLDGYPGLPPLERAYRIQRSVSKLGFDWKNPEPVLEKLHEELEELAAARKSGIAMKIEEEVGDLLFTVVNLSRLLGVDPGVALHGTNEKFVRRFAGVEERLQGMGLTPENAGLTIMDEIWNQIKAEEQKASK
jgi:tetrapyrrole methylase family protein/MazG family protein